MRPARSAAIEDAPDDQVPRDAVDDAVTVCGVRERRSDGKLPAHVTAYLTLALALFDDDYTEVATKVTGSLDRFGCWDNRHRDGGHSPLRTGPLNYPSTWATSRNC